MDTLSVKQRSRLMSRVRGRDTGPELFVRSLIHRHGYRFRVHRKDLPGTPDVVLPSMQSTIFVHGCFWHGHGCRRGRLPTSNVAFWKEKINTNRLRDNRVRRKLRKAGWKVLDIWECETKDSARLTKKLAKFFGRPFSNGKG